MKTALLSVSDKTNITQIANFLIENKVEIISTGGTAKTLTEANIPYTPIEKITGNPEAFGGRMKTISFQIGSGILHRRDNEKDLEEIQRMQFKAIDLVICNLYPFEEVANTTHDETTLIENIDIGGPTMVRAAAKNFKDVVILTSPTQYEDFIDAVKENKLTLEKRREFALAAFKMTAHYEQFIFNTLNSVFHDKTTQTIELNEIKELRYGENPHQGAKFYKLDNTEDNSLFNAKIYQGKELSYNNLLDLDAAWKSSYDALYAAEGNKQAVSVIKHLNPCGLAVANTQIEALEMAWAGDPISAFGSIISFTEEVSENTARWFDDKFIEIVVAPSFSTKALEVFSKKKNLRVIATPAKDPTKAELTYRSIAGGMLVQEEDNDLDHEFQNVTKKEFSAGLIQLAKFGSACCKHLKSNGIALVSQTANGNFWLTGAGMGQPNRLDSLQKLAIPRFNEKRNCKIEEAILISDAFFPFRDSIDVANEYNIKYIVQPGGSIKDKEVIAACDEFGIAMAMTGRRHFRH